MTNAMTPDQVRHQIKIDRLAHGNDHHVVARAVLPLAFLKKHKYEMLICPPTERFDGLPPAFVYEVRNLDVGPGLTVICPAAVQNCNIKIVRHKTKMMITAALRKLAETYGVDGGILAD